jgi:hypothetical protein
MARKLNNKKSQKARRFSLERLEDRRMFAVIEELGFVTPDPWHGVTAGAEAAEVAELNPGGAIAVHNAASVNSEVALNNPTNPASTAGSNTRPIGSEVAISNTGPIGDEVAIPDVSPIGDEIAVPAAGPIGDEVAVPNAYLVGDEVLLRTH